jgi:caffeoyl-CoA O-methyltransferase
MSTLADTFSCRRGHTKENTMAARVRSRFITDAITEYASAHSSGPDDVQVALQGVTQERTGQASGMQIGDDQAVLMEIIARAIGAKRAVEVGTFTGYSALAVARGMGPEGRLLCCDVSDEWTSIAREYWQRAGVADRIELRLGPGIETLRALPLEEQFDLAFVDADKPGYLGYYDEIVPRLRVGGLMLADNTLQSGRVIDPDANDESTVAIRAFNDRVLEDARMRKVLLPIGDGVTFIQKLSS